MNIKELAYVICQKKENMVKLSRKELKEYKTTFYSQKYREWQLDLLWEYIWGDITFEEVKKIFKMDEWGGDVAKINDWLENDKLILLEGWARDGLTDEQIAKNIGIATSTFYEWKKKEIELYKFN